jgi:hypothetical protein
MSKFVFGVLAVIGMLALAVVAMYCYGAAKAEVYFEAVEQFVRLQVGEARMHRMLADPEVPSLVSNMQRSGLTADRAAIWLLNYLLTKGVL